MVNLIIVNDKMKELQMTAYKKDIPVIEKIHEFSQPENETTEDWMECRFKDIIEIISGKNQKKVINPKGKYSIYGSGGIIGKADEYLCESGTTIIGRKGTINSPIYVNEKFWNVDTAFGLYSSNVLNRKLLYFFCVSFNFKSLDKSTTIPSLAKRDLYQISFPLPPLVIQHALVRKIETLFSSLDDGIADLKKAQEQLKTYRQAVLKKAFEGELTKEWRENNKVEFDWDNDCLGNVTTNFDGKRKPLSRKFRENFKGTYPYYGSCEHIDDVEDYIFDGKYLLIGEDGANLLSKTKPLSFIVSGKFWVNNHAHVIQPKESLSYKFLNYQFNSLQINEFVTGTAQPKLNQRNLNKIPIKIPSSQEQQTIVQEIESRLSVCDAVEENIKQGLEKAEQLRQSILKKAFSGELLSEEEIEKCRNHPDYEPAEKLLEKIRNHD